MDEKERELARINNLKGTGIKVSLVRDEHKKIVEDNKNNEKEEIIWATSNLNNMNWVVYGTELNWKLYLLVDDNCRNSNINSLIDTIEKLIKKLRKEDYSNNQIKDEMEKLLQGHFKSKREKEESSDKFETIKDKLQLIIKNLDEKKSKLNKNLQGAENAEEEIDRMLDIAQALEQNADQMKKENESSNTVVLLLVLFGVLLLAFVFINIYIQINSCLLYTSPSPRDGLLSRMPSSA